MTQLEDAPTVRTANRWTVPEPAGGPDMLDSLDDVLDERTQTLIRDRRASAHPHRRGWLVRRALAAADILGLLVAFAFAEAMFPVRQIQGEFLTPTTEILAFAATLPLWILLAKLYGLYDRDEERADHSTVDDVAGVFNMVTTGMWLVTAGAFITGFARPTVGKLFLFWVAAVLLVSVLRAVARSICRRQAAYTQNTLIVGAGHVGQTIGRKLLQHPEYGVNLVGFVDEHPRDRESPLENVPIMGSTDELDRIIRDLDVERVIVAFSQHPHSKTLQLVRELSERNLQVDIVPRLYEVMGSHVQIHAAEGLPLLGLPPARMARSNLLVKRTIDLVLSSMALIVLSPVFVAIAVAIKLDSRGPVLFRQERMGEGGRTFMMLKFRTMNADAEAQKAELAHLSKHAGEDERMFKIPSDPRITRVGSLVRRYSLDELPQLVNVLNGDMSIVGPRPLVLSEARHIGGRHRKRLDLKPGITGLWQVLGRDDIPFGEMVEIDYRYVANWSVTGDIKLMFKTVPVMKRSSA